VAVETLFHRALDRLRQVDVGAVRDLGLGQVDRQGAADEVRRVGGLRRQQHLAAGQPGPGIDHEVAHQPARVVEVEILDRADRAIGFPQLQAFEVGNAVEHRPLRQ
jgi:hypothetical protein